MADFTLESMAGFLMRAAAAMPMAQTKALTEAAKIVQEEAQAEIGHYQGAAGPFAAWAPLKPETIARKANGDTPLLETGEMQDSIDYVVVGDEAHVGSNNDKAVWQELGTARGIPPRSFLGGAAVRKSPEVAEIVGRTVYGSLLGPEDTVALPPSR